MNTKQVALYARVSSEQQAEAKTIESQLADIRARITADGFEQNSILEFVDEGYSGSTLVRPALERLRDVAAAGGLDRLYVHCPDRFARNYAYHTNLRSERQVSNEVRRETIHVGLVPVNAGWYEKACGMGC